MTRKQLTFVRRCADDERKSRLMLTAVSLNLFSVENSAIMESLKRTKTLKDSTTRKHLIDGDFSALTCSKRERFVDVFFPLMLQSCDFAFFVGIAMFLWLMNL